MKAKKDDYAKISVNNLTQDILSFLYVTDEAKKREGHIKCDDADTKVDKKSMFGIDRFDCIEPFTAEFHRVYDRLGMDDICLHPCEVLPKDVGDIDQCVLRSATDMDYWGLPVKYVITRVKRVPIKILRGIASPKSPYIYQVHDGFVHPDGSMTPIKNTYCYTGGKFLVLNRILGSGASGYKEKSKWLYDKDNEGNILFPWTIAYTNLTRWRVAIGHRPTTRISLTLNPDTMKMLFNDREKPVGKDRRTPLNHLVRGHFRKHPTKVDEYIDVVKHLRGNMKFKWNDYHCEILPPKWLLNDIQYKKLFKA